MEIREAREEDIKPACAVLEAAFRRPDEARLFRALRDGEDLAMALVAVGAPATADRHGGTAVDRPSWGGAADADPAVVARETASGSHEGEITGVAVLSHLVLPKNCLGLGPLAVAPECSDRGIGKALIAECIERARRAGHDAIFVLGQPPYYTRFGFSVEAARPFRSDYPPDFLMALELTPGALAGGGELRYAPAFAGLGR